MKSQLIPYEVNFFRQRVNRIRKDSFINKRNKQKTENSLVFKGVCIFQNYIIIYYIYIYYIIKFFQRKRVVQKPYCFLFSVCWKVEQTENRKQLDF